MVKFLGYIAVFLTVLAIAYLRRIQGLLSKLKDNELK